MPIVCMYIYILSIYIYLFTTEGFIEAALESWPEWDLDPQPLISIKTV